jgi:hypothetical protein
VSAVLLPIGGLFFRRSLGESLFTTVDIIEQELKDTEFAENGALIDPNCRFEFQPEHVFAAHRERLGSDGLLNQRCEVRPLTLGNDRHCPGLTLNEGPHFFHGVHSQTAPFSIERHNFPVYSIEQQSLIFGQKRFSPLTQLGGGFNGIQGGKDHGTYRDKKNEKNDA